MNESPSKSPLVPVRAHAPRLYATARSAARVLVLPLAAALVLACSGERATTGAPVADRPTQGGTLVIAGPNDLGDMNPLVVVEAYTQDMLIHALSLPLLRLDSVGGYEHALAYDWQLEGDSAIVFSIRDDVSWHDGVRTSAYDVVFTFDRLKTPGAIGLGAAGLGTWQAAVALDSFTVRASFQPHSEPLLDWANIAIAPRHLLDSIPTERMQQASYNRAPVGNGPFRFVSYAPNDRWIFEANTDYPEALGGRPYVDRLVWRVVPEPVAQVTELQTGGADLILSPRAEDLVMLDAQPETRALVKPSRQFHFIGWNGMRSPYGDARVRRALAMAIDRREILLALRGGRGTIAAGPIPPFHWAFPDTVQPLRFDPTAARALLDEAGIVDVDGDGLREDANGQPWTLELKIPANNAFASDVAAMMVSDFTDVGVDATTRATDFATLIQDITEDPRNFDAVLMGLENEFRLDLRGPFHSGSIGGPFQLASYRNATVDALIDRAEAAMDRAQAESAWTELQRVLRDEEPWTFLWYGPNLYAVRERVHGIVMDERGAFLNVADWWVTGLAEAN